MGTLHEVQTSDPVGNLNVPEGFGIETFSMDGAAKMPLPAGLRHFLAGLAPLGWRDQPI
ncbi:MAG: hypothetical protein AAFW01_07300 [Pseudomonadota bacterium]